MICGLSSVCDYIMRPLDDVQAPVTLGRIPEHSSRRLSLRQKLQPASDPTNAVVQLPWQALKLCVHTVNAQVRCLQSLYFTVNNLDMHERCLFGTHLHQGNGSDCSSMCRHKHGPALMQAVQLRLARAAGNGSLVAALEAAAAFVPGESDGPSDLMITMRARSLDDLTAFALGQVCQAAHQ